MFGFSQLPYRWLLAVVPALALLLLATPLSAQEEIGALEEAAIRDAVKNVASSVVRIETIGGLTQLGSGRSKILAGTGPTTGVMLTKDGYIISSAFNFAQKPTSILVGLPDGRRVPAKLVATDNNRRVTLLKVDVEALQLDDFSPPEMAPMSQVEVGQWAIAVGRTYEGGSPNMSLGIVSALNRIWGKAIQTDAKVSPSNYGGPLVDIRGRVMGILVPMSPQSNSEIAGVEWYDSGIGFAVPLQDILRVLPILKQGQNLYPGIMGITFRDSNELAEDPEVSVVRANSPAAEAGMKPGDKILEIDGESVNRIMAIRHALGPRYAGETINVLVARNEDRLDLKVTLAAKLEPYEHPFLGILPTRLAEFPDMSRDLEQIGVKVRYVYPESPAAEIGISAGDIILNVGERRINSLNALFEAMNSSKPGEEIEVIYSRGTEEFARKVKLASMPETIPAELPPASQDLPPFEGERPQVGILQDQKIAELANTYLAYVPESYHPEKSYGIVLFLHGPGRFKDEDLINQWKDACNARDLILLAPKAVDQNRWKPNEIDFVVKTLTEYLRLYNIDRNRIAVVGHQTGGAMALPLARREQELIRGVAIVDPRPGAPPQENQPNNRLAFFVQMYEKSPAYRQFKPVAAQLQKLKFPTIVRELEGPGRFFNPDELAEVVRWIDSLDRL